MKKQTNPNIKAHLVRGAFYLLVALCVIPFALGQRAATKQNAVAHPLLLGPASVATLCFVHRRASEIVHDSSHFGR